MKRLLSLLLILVMTVCLVAGCTPAADPSDSSVSDAGTSDAGTTDVGTGDAGDSQPAGTIKIGVTGPMTGAAAANGQYMKNAVDLAAEEWNANGGLLGQTIEIVYEDDQATASVALNAVNKQISDNGVFALIGPHNSGCVLSIADLCEQQNVICLTGGTSPKIAELETDNIFRIRASDSLTAALAFKFANENLATDKIGFMYINNDFGTGALEVVQAAAQAANIELLAVEGFTPGDTDMSGQLLKMQSAGCEAVVCWSDDAEGAIIARQYHEYGMDSAYALIGSATFSLSNFYNTVDASYADGIYSVNDFAYTNPDKQVVDFETKYFEKYGIHTDLYSAAYYDAACLLFTAIEKAGSLDSDAVKDVLYNTLGTYDGVMADVTFDEVGDGIHQILIIKNNGSTPEVYETVYEN